MELLKEVYSKKVEEADDADVVSKWIKRDLENIRDNDMSEQMEPFLNKLVSAWVNRDLGKISKIISNNWKEN